MISNIKYKTLKKVNSRVGLKLLFFFAITLALVIIYPEKILPLIAFVYCTSPVFFLFSSLIKKKPKTVKARPLTENSTEK